MFTYFDGGTVRYDCGITGDAPFSDPRFRALYRGWRGGLPLGVGYELHILAATPGLPIEWLYAVFDWTPTWRLRFNRTFRSHQHTEHGLENAATVIEGDGFRMLRALGDMAGYIGAVPLWTQLELANDRRNDCALGRALGVNRQKVRRWRTNAVFDPLSLARMRPNRGSPIRKP